MLSAECEGELGVGGSERVLERNFNLFPDFDRKFPAISSTYESLESKCR
jgi:hypothetical protein